MSTNPYDTINLCTLRGHKLKSSFSGTCKRRYTQNVKRFCYQKCYDNFYSKLMSNFIYFSSDNCLLSSTHQYNITLLDDDINTIKQFTMDSILVYFCICCNLLLNDIVLTINEHKSWIFMDTNVDISWLEFVANVDLIDTITICNKTNIATIIKKHTYPSYITNIISKYNNSKVYTVPNAVGQSLRNLFCQINGDNIAISIKDIKQGVNTDDKFKDHKIALINKLLLFLDNITNANIDQMVQYLVQVRILQIARLSKCQLKKCLKICYSIHQLQLLSIIKHKKIKTCVPTSITPTNNQMITIIKPKKTQTCSTTCITPTNNQMITIIKPRKTQTTYITPTFSPTSITPTDNQMITIIKPKTTSITPTNNQLINIIKPRKKQGISITPNKISSNTCISLRQETSLHKRIRITCQRKPWACINESILSIICSFLIPLHDIQWNLICKKFYGINLETNTLNKDTLSYVLFMLHQCRLLFVLKYF